jgi:hypothetical protein
MIALGRGGAQPGTFVEEWHQITRDSFIVDVRPITGDPAEGFLEVFKYAVKFSDQPPADTWHAYSVSRGNAFLALLVASGVEVPDELNDELLDDLPYVDLFSISAWVARLSCESLPRGVARLKQTGCFGERRRRPPTNQLHRS